ncbi:probable G-protein coupled receptor No9 [Gigantopelta aegis]|uniref:probable G-protein coupled receptor No9 n=1 Tax=Gigantopelta aegis TaxID=1735272 RepID=UPI001B88B43E|nr:probable G-protein coupled receptor No9 [Gigantopelta aegis]
MDSTNRTYTGAGTPTLVTSLLISVVAFFVIIIGNALTLVAVWRTRRLQTIPNMYVTSLAVADLLTGFLVVLNLLLTVEVSEDLYYNRSLCVAELIISLALGGVSVTTMVTIAIDRYIYIIHPLRYPTMTTPLRAKLIIATTWIVSSCPNVFLVFHNDWDPSVGCSLPSTIPVEFVYRFTGGYFAMASVVTCLFYGAILRTAWRQNRRVAADLKNSELTKSSWKLLKLFLVVFGVFFVCWFFVSLVFILGRFLTVPAWASYISFRMLFVNSGANFFIYAWMNRDFRIAFKSILCQSGNACCVLRETNTT